MPTTNRRLAIVALAAAAALVFTSSAWAHARVSPPIALAKALRLHPGRPDREVGRDDADRVHASVRLQHRLVRAVAGLEAHGAADRLRRETRWSRR